MKKLLVLLLITFLGINLQAKHEFEVEAERYDKKSALAYKLGDPKIGRLYRRMAAIKRNAVIWEKQHGKSTPKSYWVEYFRLDREVKVWCDKHKIDPDS